MKKKIDFILQEDSSRKLVFRFYPQKSSCHSFDDNPPKTWDEVYKVYYRYSIFRTWKDDGYTDTLFSSGCDECSIISCVADCIKLIVEGKRQITVTWRDEEHTSDILNREMGVIGAGVSWTINECKEPDTYEIILWRDNDVGYRFYIKKKRLKQFGLYLRRCCEYMLAHGRPI
jgi:hypothetical protein